MFWGKTAQQLTDIERALLAQEVQRLKMQEDEAAGDVASVAPQEESGWARFMEGFREGWNEEVPKRKSIEYLGYDNLNYNNDAQDENSFFPKVGGGAPGPFDFCHPDYKEFWG